MSIFQIASVLVGARRSPEEPSASPNRTLDFVDGVESRRAALSRIASLLGDLSRDETRALVGDVVRSFARRVYDLPASESYHHFEPWGLLDHSIDVAEFAVRSALSANFMESVAPHPEVQEFRVPRLRYAAFLLGLLHDVGKILGVSVQSGRRVWNPFAEDLSEFVILSKDTPSMIWRAGRGVHAHEYHTAYLLSLFLPGAVAEYLSAPLLMELLERRTPAAIKVFDLVSESDQRSTREDLERREKAREAPRMESLEIPELTVGYRELVMKAFAEGLREDLFRANTLDGDLFLGREYVALRYPGAVGKLAQIARERLGRASQKARMLPAGDPGARELANHLSELDLIFRDAQTGSWKVEMSLGLGGAFQGTAAVLFRRSLLFPDPGSGNAPELFPGTVAFTRPSDHSELPIGGFSPPPPPAAPGAPAPALGGEIPRSHPTPESGSGNAKPPPQASPSAPQVNPVRMAALRSNVLPGVLLEDIREAILSGKIPVNQWNAQVYVRPDRTYFVTPNGFRRLVAEGLYSIDPSKGGSVYLDALAKLDCVVPSAPGGRVVTKIRLRENANPCSVVVFQTRGLFKTEEEIARVGFWTETEILEGAAPPPPALDPEGEEEGDA